MQNRFRVKFPVDYVDLVCQFSGGEGFLANGRFLRLYDVGELASINSAFDVERFAPGLLIIGSDGGGQSYAYDTRGGAMGIVAFDDADISLESARLLGTTLKEFIAALSAAT